MATIYISSSNPYNCRYCSANRCNQMGLVALEVDKFSIPSAAVPDPTADRRGLITSHCLACGLDRYRSQAVSLRAPTRSFNPAFFPSVLTLSIVLISPSLGIA